MSRRGCYREYLRENGYKLTEEDSKGNFKVIWIGRGDAPNPSKVYSWTKYRNFWNKNYNHLKKAHQPKAFATYVTSFRCFTSSVSGKTIRHYLMLSSAW